MTHNEAVIVLTEQIQDHLPVEKWADYEEAMMNMSLKMHSLVSKYTGEQP